ncbi:MAG: DUF169 domain-containing protein [Candidatus Methanoperedens sp.]|jgi:uncharacterized protein (DUF169 family)|nr:DUF169 domain-containing protein [Candidatus Methanoperedens sp.]PKL53888.1 MAG: hypothetical protein CVV36_04695 [Candidatus Methanoperedenaceae archaeon HGW-Methanoperedenaceae-1]
MDKESKNYNNLAKRLTAVLGLKGAPVAVALRDDIPNDIQKGKPARHCEMVQTARLDGTQFYATADEQTCKGGAAVMGIIDVPENVANGEFYYKLGAFASVKAAKNTMGLLPKIGKRSKAVLYAPLESAGFVPDMVIVLGSPKQAMQIVQADLYKEGGRIETGVAGKQSLCGDIVAHTLNTGTIQVSLACAGSRGHAKVADDELIVGIPAARLGQLMDSLETLFKK